MKLAAVIRGALFLLIFCPIEALHAEAEFRSYDMTLAQTQDIILDWLEQNRFEVYRLDSRDRQVQLTAERNADRLQIDLRPHSPLATQVRIEPLSDAPRIAGSLEKYLRGYLQTPEPPAAHDDDPIPAVVSARLQSVVCLYAGHGAGAAQFSGFVVDPAGYIVCTAHDLNPDQQIRVMLFDGRELSGRVVRIDVERDLSLIKVDSPLASAVPLRNGRFMINPGDPLFAITCPKPQNAIIQSGMLAGPPRRVQGFPLWQVNMHVDHGSSGSPVFDAQGCLAAVVKGRFRGTDAIGFLIPFETLMNFLEKN